MMEDRRLIEANALTKKIGYILGACSSKGSAIENILAAIYSAPAIDAVEVVHGQWEDEHGGKYANPRYRCSDCKERALYKFERDLLDNWKEVQALTPYCPDCGAKMDGERSEGE